MQAPVNTSQPVLISEGTVVGSGDTKTAPVSKSTRAHICAFPQCKCDAFTNTQETETAGEDAALVSDTYLWPFAVSDVSGMKAIYLIQMNK